MTLRSFHTLPVICVWLLALLTTTDGAHADAASEVRSLDVYRADGTLHVLLGVYDVGEERSEMRYLRSNDHGGTWSTAKRIDSGLPAPYARGRGTDFHLAAAGNKLVAVWMTKGSGFMGRGPLVTAFSEDGGATWQGGATPADDGTDGDHAFIDVTADPAERFHVIWLDKRSGDNKGLIHARSDNTGRSWSANTVVDAETCACCWNAIACDTTGNLYALYRDLEPRDMVLARSADAGKTWSRVGPVGNFGWQFNGCPHVGGAVVPVMSNGTTTLHSLVWTGKRENRGLHYLRSNPDYTWSDPASLGSGDATFPDLAANESGHLVAVWDEIVHDGSAIFLSTSTDNGISWSAPRQLSLPGAEATHARVVGLGRDFHIFWTETADQGTTWQHRRL